MDDRKPLVIAHRGASAHHPENTIEAFTGAAERGADWIEIDVRRTRDGVLVIHHDAHLSDGRVIVECDASSLPDHIPSLIEALEAAGDLGVNIEIKNLRDDPDYDADNSVAEAVAGLVHAYLPIDRVLVSSFNMDDIDKLRGIDPTIPTGFLVFDVSNPSQLIEWVSSRGHGAVHPHASSVDDSLVAGVHAADMEVHVWTVDEPDRIAGLADMGVDGIITNDPTVACKVLASE